MRKYPIYPIYPIYLIYPIYPIHTRYPIYPLYPLYPRSIRSIRISPNKSVLPMSKQHVLRTIWDAKLPAGIFSEQLLGVPYFQLVVVLEFPHIRFHNATPHKDHTCRHEKVFEWTGGPEVA